MRHNPKLINTKFSNEYKREIDVLGLDRDGFHTVKKIYHVFRNFFPKRENLFQPIHTWTYTNSLGKKLKKVPFDSCSETDNRRCFLFMSEDEFQVLTYEQYIFFCKRV